MKENVILLLQDMVIDLKDVEDDLLGTARRARGYEFYNYYNRALGVKKAINYIETTIDLINVGDIKIDWFYVFSCQGQVFEWKLIA